MSEVKCNLCGKRLEPEMGGVVCDGCFRPREDWLKEIEELQALNCEVVAALEAVEWIPLANRRVCPNCGRRWDQGHAPTCKLAAALAKAKVME